MKSQSVWLLLVSLVLVCGLIGCGEKPQPVVEEPKTTIKEPKPLASEQEVTEKPKVVMEKPEMAISPFDADQAKQHQQAWAEYLGVPVEITNSIGMKLRLIPPGEFMMGSPESDGDADSFEKPQHKVRITQPFYLGVTEVTQAEYEEVTGENPSLFSKGGYGADRVSGKDTSGYPVETVSWEDAVEFCKRLSTKEGKTYRLPTEAEWEYACRAGTTTRYSFGDDPNDLGEYAWYRDNSEETHSVGEKKPNAWGLYDMHGNVWEWCVEPWAKDYRRDTLRMVRGGSWDGGARFCRVAVCFIDAPGTRSGNLGFRIATVPPGGQPSTSPNTSE